MKNFRSELFPPSIVALAALACSGNDSSSDSGSATGGTSDASLGGAHSGGTGGEGATMGGAHSGGTDSGGAGRRSTGGAGTGGNAGAAGSAGGAHSGGTDSGGTNSGGRSTGAAGAGGGDAGTDGSSNACVTSEPKGRCGPYLYPTNTGSDGSNTVIDQNVWNPIPGWHQTLHATDPGNWYVTANMPAGNTAVVSFANTWQESLPSPNALTDFSSIYSSFSENTNVTSGTSAGWGYDIWLNSWADEVMIQHDNVRRGSCDDIGVLATATFGGSGGVPVQDWNLCKYGTEIIWQPVTNGAYVQIPSSSVDILAMLTWLMDHGHLPQGSVLDNGVSWGVEICSTGGTDEDFRVTGFSITASR